MQTIKIKKVFWNAIINGKKLIELRKVKDINKWNLLEWISVIDPDTNKKIGEIKFWSKRPDTIDILEGLIHEKWYLENKEWIQEYFKNEKLLTILVIDKFKEV